MVFPMPIWFFVAALITGLYLGLHLLMGGYDPFLRGFLAAYGIRDDEHPWRDRFKIIGLLVILWVGCYWAEVGVRYILSHMRWV